MRSSQHSKNDLRLPLYVIFIPRVATDDASISDPFNGGHNIKGWTRMRPLSPHKDVRNIWQPSYRFELDKVRDLNTINWILSFLSPTRSALLFITKLHSLFDSNQYLIKCAQQTFPNATTCQQRSTFSSHLLALWHSPFSWCNVFRILCKLI